MYYSTKIIELGSCAFRQPQAVSHCRYIHGYRLTAKFWFEADELDVNNWVVDFGGLKGLKKLFQEQFDHTTCIARTDPKLDEFKRLRDAGVCDLRVMDGVGIEKFAEYCHTVAESYVNELTDSRCRCTQVEVFEHENNSAIYKAASSVTLQDAEQQPEEPVEEKAPHEDSSPTGKEGPVHPVESQPEEPVPQEKQSLFRTEKTVNKWVNPKYKKTTNSWLF